MFVDSNGLFSHKLFNVTQLQFSAGDVMRQLQWQDKFTGILNVGYIAGFERCSWLTFANNLTLQWKQQASSSWLQLPSYLLVDSMRKLRYSNRCVCVCVIFFVISVLKELGGTMILNYDPMSVLNMFVHPEAWYLRPECFGFIQKQNQDTPVIYME